MERKYNIADLSDYLSEAEEFQTFTYYPNNLESSNTYTGFDELSISPIQDNHIYAVIHDGNIAQIENGEPLNISYFFDQATYDKFVDSSTGEFDACALSEALQLNPGNFPTYRNSIACFDVNPEYVQGGILQLPTGICTANTQFGGGGGHQTFAPNDISIDLQKSGSLKINRDKSHFHTGINIYVDKEKRVIVNSAIRERQENCIKNDTPHHDTSVNYKNGFEATPNLIEGEPFDYLKILSKQDFAEIVDVEVNVVEEVPPLLYDLTTLQIEANRCYGITAAETLASVQHLYEEGDVTYPRTDSNYISSDMEDTVESLLASTEDNS